MKKGESACIKDLSSVLSSENRHIYDPQSLQPVNDSMTSDFSKDNPYAKSKTAHNKMLMRRRRRSRHPLRDIRLKRGFTLEELADLADLSPSYLSRLESGSRRLNADTLEKISRILNCHPGDLLTSESFSRSMSWVAERDNDKFSPTHPYYIKDLICKVLNTESYSMDGYEFVDGGNVFEWVTRPFNLVGNDEAYAFYVTKSCQAGRYNKNEYFLADPCRHLVNGCRAVVYNANGKVFLGTIIKDSDDPFSFFSQSQNPMASLHLEVSDAFETRIEKKVLTLEMKKITAIHRIVGSFDFS